ncbi:MAG: HAMP domain-containing protein, partial [Cyanobacteria bacterium J06632_22]
MLKTFKRSIGCYSIRLKIAAGYLFIVGLSAIGLSASFSWGERYLEEPAIVQQNETFKILLRLNELQGLLLENKIALLPYVREPDEISDSGHLLTGKSQQLKRLLEHPDWAELSSPITDGISLADSDGMLRCRQAVAAHDDVLSQLLRDRPLGQVPSQIELILLMSGSAAQQMENCALDLQRLIVGAEATQISAAQALIEARQWEKQLATISLLIAVMIAAVLALYTSRQITRPLQQASQVAQRISQDNNFNLRVEVVYQDEVGAFAQSFNRLLTRVQDLLLEQKQSEKQLEQYSHHLESTVAVRTQELQTKNQDLEDTLQHLRQTQAQLIQSEKMSGLGQMVAGVAHEINNLVNFIHGNLSHARRYFEDVLSLIQQYQHYYPEPPEALQQSLEEIDLVFLQQDTTLLFQSMQTGTQRIREIVLSLRTFSRLDESDLKAVNLHEGIESTLMILAHRLKAQAPQQDIEIMRVYGELPAV